MELSSLGRVTICVGGRRVNQEQWRTRRPLAANYREFANAVLAASAVPATTPSTIGALLDRGPKLMLAVIRLRNEMSSWRALYGSPLSVDERFFAVMVWSWQHDLERLRARLRAARERHLREPAAGMPPATPRLASLGVRSARLGTDVSKVFASALGPTPSYRQLLGLTVHGRLFAQQPVMAEVERMRQQSPAWQAVPDASATLARLGIAHRGTPSGLASVLRPYTSRPYSPLAASETFRAPISPALGDSVARARPPTALSSLSEQLAKSVPAFGISEAVREALGDGFGLPALTRYHERLAAITGGLATASFTAERLGLAMETARLADGVLKGFPQPLLDGRARLFGASAALRALLPTLPSIRLPALATLDFAAQSRDVFAPMRGVPDLFVEVAEFMRVWEDDPLWFLLSVFGVGAARRFGGLSREQVEEALLSALTDVICDGEYVAALRWVLRDAPYLNDVTREWLDHALEHAAAGEWVQAVPPMLAALEGALHRAAVGRALIVDRAGKFMAVEALVKQMAVDEDYSAFVIRRVFGGTGNAFRHGRADSGERDQVLFAIVALAGWVDFFLELSAMDVLASELSDRLGAAIERVTGVPELPNGA